MSRRRKQRKRWYRIDPKYQSFLVHIIVGHLIRNGKKSLSYRILYSVLRLIHEKTRVEPLVIVEHSVRIVIPTVQLKSRRVGGTTYQVPIEVGTHRGTAIAIKWILHAAQIRLGRGIVNCLSAEIVDATRGSGGALRKREEVHRMAEANKAFARYRFLYAISLSVSNFICIRHRLNKTLILSAFFL